MSRIPRLSLNKRNSSLEERSSNKGADTDRSRVKQSTQRTSNSSLSNGTHATTNGKRKSPRVSLEGTLVWCMPSEADPLWIRGTVISCAPCANQDMGSKWEISITTEDNETVTIKTKCEDETQMQFQHVRSRAAMSGEALQSADLTSLPIVNEPEVTEYIRQCYTLSQKYISVGSRVSVLLNTVPSSGDSQAAQLRQHFFIPQSNHDVLATMQPSPIRIAYSAFQAAVAAKPTEAAYNQTILLLGESGTGKTSACQAITYSLGHILRNSHLTYNDEVKIVPLEDDPLYNAHVILEEFGHARTLRTQSSSRFSRHIQYYFTTDHEFSHFTLRCFNFERERVVRQSSGEFNYHIMYDFATGLTEEQLCDWGLETIDQFQYINQQFSVAETHAAVMRYKTFQAALSHFRIHSANRLLEILTGILHLGEIDFVEQPVAGEDATDFSSSADSAFHIHHTCELLCISPDALLTAVGRRSIVIDKTRIQKNLNLQGTLAARDQFAIFIYTALFKYLVHSMNTVMEKQAMFSSEARPHHILNLLDFASFECLERNGLDQLCFNYCNEKLYNYMNAQFYTSEANFYSMEKVPLHPMEYPTNAATVDLLENKAYGVFALCDEQYKLKASSSDEKLAASLYTEHTSNPAFIASRAEHTKHEFIIKHYSVYVKYKVSGFVENNKLEPPVEVLNCFKNSSDSFIKDLAAYFDPYAHTGIQRGGEDASVASGPSTPSLTHSPPAIAKGAYINRTSSAINPSTTRGAARGIYSRSPSSMQVGGSPPTGIPRGQSIRGASFGAAPPKTSPPRPSLTRQGSAKSTRKLVKPPTATSLCIQQMQAVINEIKNTNIRYVVCVKTSEGDSQFDQKYVNAQVKAANLTEVVKFYHKSHPHRFDFVTFINRYAVLLSMCVHEPLAMEWMFGLQEFRKQNAHDNAANAANPLRAKRIAARLLTLLPLYHKDEYTSVISDGYRVGQTYVFLNAACYYYFESKQRELLHKTASAIQSAWKRYELALNPPPSKMASVVVAALATNKKNTMSTIDTYGSLRSSLKSSVSYKVKAAVYVLQMWGRVFVAMIRRRRAVAAVRCIQANYRGYRGRLLAEEVRKEQEKRRRIAVAAVFPSNSTDHMNGTTSRGDASSADDSASSGSFSQIKGHDAYEHTSDEEDERDAAIMTAEQKLEESSMASSDSPVPDIYYSRYTTTNNNTHTPVVVAASTAHTAQSTPAEVGRVIPVNLNGVLDEDVDDNSTISSSSNSADDNHDIGIDTRSDASSIPLQPLYQSTSPSNPTPQSMPAQAPAHEVVARSTSIISDFNFSESGSGSQQPVYRKMSSTFETEEKGKNKIRELQIIIQNLENDNSILRRKLNTMAQTHNAPIPDTARLNNELDEQSPFGGNSLLPLTQQPKHAYSNHVMKTLELLESKLSHLKKPTVIYKVSRNGNARKTEIRITGDYQHITWKASLMSSKKQSDCVVDLRNVWRLVKGKMTPPFQLNDAKIVSLQDDLCFSLVYGFNTLDLCAVDKESYNIWFNGLKHILQLINGDHVESGVDRQLLRKKWNMLDTKQLGVLNKKNVIRLVSNLGIQFTRASFTHALLRSTIGTHGTDEITFSQLHSLVYQLRRRPDLEILWSKILVGYDFSLDIAPLEMWGDFDLNVLNEVIELPAFMQFWKLAQGRVLSVHDAKRMVREGMGELYDEQFPVLSYYGFMNIMTHPKNDAYDPVKCQLTSRDLSYPLHCYHIATTDGATHIDVISNSESNQDLLQSMSILPVNRPKENPYVEAVRQGVRCLELRCYEDKDSRDNVDIYLGKSRERKIRLKDTLSEIAAVVFHVSPFPLIILLEMHLSLPQQKRVAKLLQSTFGKHIYAPTENTMSVLPSPMQLKRRILIFLTNRHKPTVPPSTASLSKFSASAHSLMSINEIDEHIDEQSELTDDFSSEDEHHVEVKSIHDDEVSFTFDGKESDEEESAASPAAPKHIVRMTSQAIEVETADHRKIVLRKDSNLADVVSSQLHPAIMNLAFSERVLSHSVKEVVEEMHENITAADTLTGFNMKHLSHVYLENSAKIMGSFGGIVSCWDTGFQMVSMPHDVPNLATILHHGKFRKNGNCGYVLKTMRLLKPMVSSGGAGRLVLHILSGRELPTNVNPEEVFGKDKYGRPPPRAQSNAGGSSLKNNGLCVLVDISNGAVSDVQYKTKKLKKQGRHPFWNEVFSTPVKDRNTGQVTFRVYCGSELCTAFASIPFNCLRSGFRTVQLFTASNTNSAAGAMPLDLATLFIRVKFESVDHHMLLREGSMIERSSSRVEASEQSAPTPPALSRPPLRSTPPTPAPALAEKRTPFSSTPEPIRVDEDPNRSGGAPVRRNSLNIDEIGRSSPAPPSGSSPAAPLRKTTPKATPKEVPKTEPRRTDWRHASDVASESEDDDADNMWKSPF